jgi:hypothetical protein
MHDYYTTSDLLDIMWSQSDSLDFILIIPY